MPSHPSPSPDELLRRAERPAAEALRLHPFYRGKMQTLPKCPVRDLRDLAVWYTPGVAAPCKEIVREPDQVYAHTNRGNTVAVISDGSRVLGLGDIGPEAGLPVMEGKALLFKYLGGVDAVALCLRTRSPEELVAAVRALEPSFGGINLEDIAQPKCFRILDTLRRELAIPVWHDDQQGTAVVTLAALWNACLLTGRELGSCRIALIGAGAAGIAVYRLLKSAGADPDHIVACDSRGILHPGRADLQAARDRFPEKWALCQESNAEKRTGGIPEALAGADVCLAFSRPAPGLIPAGAVRAMADGAIVFACANPAPEIWPWEAAAAGARIVATGRGDFPNQVNNSLCFPGIFRGVLDVRASAITDSMALAAARSLAAFAQETGLREDRILPSMDEWALYPRLAAAAAEQAMADGVARAPRALAEMEREAAAIIRQSRDALSVLMREGLIPAPPSPA